MADNHVEQEIRYTYSDLVIFVVSDFDYRFSGFIVPKKVIRKEISDQ